jgi:ABC-type polysaccharide/polyol phosphate export permease
MAWSLLHPIMLLGSIFLLFSAKIGKDIPNYGAFLLIAPLSGIEVT